jgi:methionyl-tRNA formyltransferase
MDSGPILAQSSVLTPEEVEPATAIAAIDSAIVSVLDRGIPRALAGDPGETQDSAAASCARNFSCDEAVVHLNLSKHLFQCRVTALLLAGVQPWVMLDKERHPLRAVRPLPGIRSEASGVVSLTTRRAIVAVNNGVLELELGEMHL